MAKEIHYRWYRSSVSKTRQVLKNAKEKFNTKQTERRMDKRRRTSISSDGERIPKKISGLSSGRREKETAAEKRQRKLEAVRELRSEFNVSDLTKLTGLPRRSFYYSDNHPKQDNHKEERELVQKIYHENK